MDEDSEIRDGWIELAQRGHVVELLSKHTIAGAEMIYCLN